MSNDETLTILGAGIAGISAGYHAKQNDVKAVVYEAASRPGGLVDNFTINGFRFDNAIHLSFATESEVREVFDRTDYVIHPAVSWCRDGDVWLKHPVQNNIFPLPVDEKVDLISGLIDRKEGPILNYEDWLLHQYGKAISNRWPLPYTKKYWTLQAKEMGIDWIGNRMRRADVREILQGAFTAETPNHYYAKEMRYPSRGGYLSFIQALIDDTNIHCDHRVIRIDLSNRTVYFENGKSVGFTSLINTLPLPKLIELIDEVPDDVRGAASSLFSTSIDLISVGFRVPDIQPHLWFYIYDADVLAARAYSPSIKSADNVPDGCSSLQFEIYSSVRNPQKNTPDEMKSNTLMALRKFGILQEDSDVLFMHHKHMHWGNVVFDLGMEARRDLVINWLKSVKIVSAGRFGEWDYLWSNQAFMSGKRAFEISQKSNGA